jgi:hypothetical protein
LVNGIQKPIKNVESILGQEIDLTDDIIKSIMEMIEEMRNLFNARKVEVMFLQPFKDAALTALSSIDKLYKLIISTGTTIIDDAKDTVMGPINDLYASLRSALNDVSTSAHDIIVYIEDKLGSTEHYIQGDFMRLKTITSAMKGEVGTLRAKIREELSVVGEDAFSIKMIVPDMASKAAHGARIASLSMKKVGTVVETDFSDIEASLKKRFINEHAALDMLYMVIIVCVIAMLVFVFAVTHSVRVVIIVVIMMVVYFTVYLIIDMIVEK